MMLLAWVKMPKYRSWWRIPRLRFKQLSLLNKLVEKKKSVKYPGGEKETAKTVIGKSGDMNTEGKRRVFPEREGQRGNLYIPWIYLEGAVDLKKKSLCFGGRKITCLDCKCGHLVDTLLQQQGKWVIWWPERRHRPKKSSKVKTLMCFAHIWEAHRWEERFGSQEKEKDTMFRSEWFGSWYDPNVSIRGRAPIIWRKREQEQMPALI